MLVSARPKLAEDWGSLTIPGTLREAAASCPDLEALIGGERQLPLSYRQLDEAVTLFARSLAARGVSPGERVALWAPNSARWVISALGILAAGAVLVPVNTRFKGAEVRYVLVKARVSAVVLDDNFLGNSYLSLLRDSGAAEGTHEPTPERPLPLLPEVHTVVTVHATTDLAALSWDRFHEFASRVPASQIDSRIAALDPQSVSDILFTSGTTGDPKGAMTTHEANIRVDRAWADMVGLRAGDRYLIINPMFHSFGYRAGVIACLIRRATIVPQAVFDVIETLRIIQRERITVFPGAPTIYTSILDHPRRSEFDTSSVRLAVTGAATVPVELIHRIRKDLGFRNVVTAYGLTETAGTSTVCPSDAPDDKISTTSGIAIPGTEVAVMDQAGGRLSAGQVGEVVVRGFNVMVGYFEDPEATAAAIDGDGWLHTGDVGFLDNEGYLTITDRIKDMFTVGGFNVYPAEIERLLAGHPKISDSAVIGVPDARLGEVGHAFVTPRPGVTLTAVEVISYCRANLANFKVPRTVSFTNELPRTASGKVQKFRLTLDH